MSSVSIEPIKPKFRGVSHQYGFFVAIVLSCYLLSFTPTEKFWPILIYCTGLCGMLGTSSMYHRGNWSKGQKVWLQRLDYVMISFMIAAGFTPFCLFVFSSWYSQFVLWAVWFGVAFCIVLNLLWVDSPKIFRTSLYIALGWLGFPLFFELIENAGWLCASLCLLGGILHSIGAVVYARQFPDPYPKVFGFHEIFHIFVLIASFLHYYCVVSYTI